MNDNICKMNVLIIGAGVIGTVYAAQLARAGNAVSVYDHSKRTERIKYNGLIIKDLATNIMIHETVNVVSNLTSTTYDLVIIAIPMDQTQSVLPILRDLKGNPTVLFFGNTTITQSTLAKDLSKTVELGFPGIGGSLVGDTVEYIRITQQPTAFQTNASTPTLEFIKIIQSKGFKVAHISDMEGWLLYHAVFISCICGALYRSNISPTELSKDTLTLTLMCKAIEEGFRSLRRQGCKGQPLNLRILHLQWFRPLAVLYWRHIFNSPLGEIEFAGHARHAQLEMEEIAKKVLSTIKDSPSTYKHLQKLLKYRELQNEKGLIVQ